MKPHWGGCARGCAIIRARGRCRSIRRRTSTRPRRPALPQADAVVLVEVIEHLDPGPCKRWSNVVLRDIAPPIAVVNDAECRDEPASRRETRAHAPIAITASNGTASAFAPGRKASPHAMATPSIFTDIAGAASAIRGASQMRCLPDNLDRSILERLSGIRGVESAGLHARMGRFDSNPFVWWGADARTFLSSCPLQHGNEPEW